MKGVPARAPRPGHIAFQVIAGEKCVVRRDTGARQRVLENPGIGFVRAGLAGNDNFLEPSENTELREHRSQPPVEVGQDADPITSRERIEHRDRLGIKRPNAWLRELIIDRVEVMIPVEIFRP